MRTAAPICAALLVIALVGCDGRPTSVPPSASVKSTSVPAPVSWRDEMSAACSDLGAAVDDLPLSSGRDGLKTYLKSVLALELAFDRRASSIEPSSLEGGLVEKTARTRREWEGSLARLLRDVVRDDEDAALAEADTTEMLAHRANASLQDLGLTQCLLPFTGIPG